MHNFCSIGKIFTSCIEQASRHPCAKYLSDRMILKFSHKLAYLNFDNFKWITMNNVQLSDNMMYRYYTVNISESD